MATLSLTKPSDRVQIENPDHAYKAHVLKSYPSVFDASAPKPLRIDTRSDLLKIKPPWVSGVVVSRFLKRWTRRKAYIRAVARGGNRFALSGMPAGTVSDEHRGYAASQLKKKA